MMILMMMNEIICKTVTATVKNMHAIVNTVE